MKKNPKKPKKTAAKKKTSAGGAYNPTSARAKWSSAVIGQGYLIIPSMLLKFQGRLGLSSPQLVVLFQIADWWNSAEKHPWTAKETIAKHMGIKARQVQRQITALQRMKLLKRRPQSDYRGNRPNAFDLSGLVDKLKKLVPESEASKKKGGAI